MNDQALEWTRMDYNQAPLAQGMTKSVQDLHMVIGLIHFGDRWQEHLCFLSPDHIQTQR